MSRSIRIPSMIFVFICLGLLVLHLARFFLRAPAVWPDESLFAAPALDLIRHGKMGTPLLTEVLSGIGERTYWMPPVYFVLLSGVFKVFGPGIVVMRGFTLLVSLGVMALTALLALEIGLGLWGAIFGFCILALHEVFEWTMVVGRMESFVMLFLFSSIWLVARELNRSEINHADLKHADLNGTEQVPMRATRFALAGLLAGLAAMTHPFGIVGCAALAAAVLFHSPQSVSLFQRFRYLVVAGLAAMASVIPWGVYILQSPEDFKNQFGSQMARKAAMVAENGLDELLRFNLAIFSLKGWILGVLIFALGLVGIFFCAVKKRGAFAVLWAQVFILLMLLTTREFWYPAYLIPLTAVGLGVLTQREWTRHLPRKVALSLFVLAWMGSGFWWLRGGLHRVRENVAMALEHLEPYAYLEWAHRISDAIPQNKRVLIAAIPDPTFGLFEREDLTLREFSPVHTEPALYERYLASADYIVFTEREADPRVAIYARKHGVLVATVAMPNDPEFKAYIFQTGPLEWGPNRINAR